MTVPGTGFATQTAPGPTATAATPERARSPTALRRRSSRASRQTATSPRPRSRPRRSSRSSLFAGIASARASGLAVCSSSRATSPLTAASNCHTPAGWAGGYRVRLQRRREVAVIASVSGVDPHDGAPSGSDRPNRSVVPRRGCQLRCGFRRSPPAHAAAQISARDVRVAASSRTIDVATGPTNWVVVSGLPVRHPHRSRGRRRGPPASCPSRASRRRRPPAARREAPFAHPRRPATATPFLAVDRR